MTNIKTKNRITNIAIYILLSVMVIIWLFPIVWIILCSFREEQGADISYFFPKTWSFKNYIDLFKPDAYYFPRWFANTLIVAVCTCILSSLYVLMVSYAFSRLRFKLRKPLMNIVLILGMFPGFMSMIAVYYILKALNMTQTLLALILVYSGGAGLNYYIAKGFFDTIPRNMDEAARIDGATQNQVFWKIIIPLSKPIIVYTILTSFMAPWMDFIFVSVIMKDNYNNFTVALGLYRMLDREHMNDYFTRFCASSVLVAIPITGLFISMQKFYIEGVTGGSVKG
ncbi:MAG TPA: sugar ABC transporter permease [Clostridia bacterium]